MLEIKRAPGENIDKALRRFKRKYKDTKLLDQIRNRKYFKKPSIVKREQKLKAIHKSKLQNANND